MTTTAELPQNGRELVSDFLPTPDRVSQFLELKHDEVVEKLKSVEGRQILLEQLLVHEDELKEAHPDFDSSELKTNLDVVGETLHEKERFLQAAKDPEKKGMFRRAFDRIKGFAKKHPIVTTLICVAGLAAAVGGGYYLWSSWELLLHKFGVSEFVGAGEAAADAFSPITPPPSPMAAGGALDLPVPPGPPGMGTGV